MATFRKRGKNQWQAKIRRKGWPKQTKTFETKSDAEAWAREIEGEMDRGVFVSRKEAENTTLEEAFKRFIDEYVPRYAQPRTERNRINHILTYPLASRFLASIRGKDLADFVKTREKEGASANTIRLDLDKISILFSVASKDWGMEALSNPVKKINRPKLPSGRDRRLRAAIKVDGKVLSEEELLLQHASPKMQAIIPFAIETAMRRGEIAGLTWDRINFKAKTAHLDHTKNGEPRTVPLSPKAIGILKGLLPSKTIPISGNVFGLEKDQITDQFTRARTKAKIKNLRFHDLRHEATSRLFEETDLDLMEIRSITGHKSLQMLSGYTHLRADRLADRLHGKKRGQ